MAMAVCQEEDSFTCPVCLDLLTDPVAIPCGHNFCMRCIKGCWDQEDQRRVYSCPMCKHTFTPRPVLYKNPLIAEMVEKFSKTRIQASTPAHGYSGPRDVECDVCTGTKLKAVKSCLECLVSYCEAHFQTHNAVHLGRKHLVIDATDQLQERTCSRHNKVLEIFCRTDQNFICYLCTMDEHRGHDTVTAAEERAGKQRQIWENKKRFQQRIQEREKELQELRKAVETLKSSAQAAVKDSERIFSEMIHTIEKRRSQVTEMIRAQEKAEVSRAEGLLKRLEQEIAELKRRDAELEQLSQSQDHVHFLKNVQLVNTPPQSKDLSYVHVNQSFSFDAMRRSVSTLQAQLDDLFMQDVMRISSTVSDVRAVFAEPVTREEFLQCFCYLTLDPNTANRDLLLSQGNRRVDYRDWSQLYPDHPERFDGFSQVLCREGVSGRCYWEVEWSEWVNIAVSYKSISRKGWGNESGFGLSDQSWSLFLRSSSSSVCHNSKEIKLPLVASSRIGVYVDHRAGTLAFYSISDTMTLLHRVQTTFAQTLYPGFLVGQRSAVVLV